MCNNKSNQMSYFNNQNTAPINTPINNTAPSGMSVNKQEKSFSYNTSAPQHDPVIPGTPMMQGMSDMSAHTMGMGMSSMSPPTMGMGMPDMNPPTMGMIRPEGAAIMPETLAEPIYTPGYLRTQIGRLMRVEFLIGNFTTDRVGVLSAVGANFIILDSLEQRSRIVCDLFAIKFVTIIDSAAAEAIIAVM